MLTPKLDHPRLQGNFQLPLFHKLLMSKYKWVHTQTDLGCNFEVLQKNVTQPPVSNPFKKVCWHGEGVDNQKCISVRVKVEICKWTSLTVMVAGLMQENSDDLWLLKFDF